MVSKTRSKGQQSEIPDVPLLDVPILAPRGASGLGLTIQEEYHQLLREKKTPQPKVLKKLDNPEKRVATTMEPQLIIQEETAVVDTEPRVEEQKQQKRRKLVPEAVEGLKKFKTVVHNVGEREKVLNVDAEKIGQKEETEKSRRVSAEKFFVYEKKKKQTVKKNTFEKQKVVKEVVSEKLGKGEKQKTSVAAEKIAEGNRDKKTEKEVITKSPAKKVNAADVAKKEKSKKTSEKPSAAEMDPVQDDDDFENNTTNQVVVYNARPEKEVATKNKLAEEMKEKTKENEGEQSKAVGETIKPPKVILEQLRKRKHSPKTEEKAEKEHKKKKRKPSPFIRHRTSPAVFIIFVVVKVRRLDIIGNCILK